MTPRIMSATAGVLLLIAALAACAGPSDPIRSPAHSSIEPRPTASTAPEGSADADVPAGTLTCEAMISPGVVVALTAAGWSAQSKEFRVGGVELTDGLLCFWADYSIASDQGQLYGWAPIDAEDAATAQAGLLAEGWKGEEGPDGIYVTEDPQYAMEKDDDGYGMTYLFGEGWVRFADTRQGLILIEWPK